MGCCLIGKTFSPRSLGALSPVDGVGAADPIFQHCCSMALVGGGGGDRLELCFHHSSLGRGPRTRSGGGEWSGQGQMGNHGLDSFECLRWEDVSGLGVCRPSDPRLAISGAGTPRSPPHRSGVSRAVALGGAVAGHLEVFRVCELLPPSLCPSIASLSQQGAAAGLEETCPPGAGLLPLLRICYWPGLGDLSAGLTALWLRHWKEERHCLGPHKARRFERPPWGFPINSLGHHQQ